MSGQANALTTKGIICKNIKFIEKIVRCVIPLNLKLKTDKFKLNLKKIDPVKLNLAILTTKINLINASQTKLSLKVIDRFKLNLKKCED